MRRYEQLDHTADVAVRVYGANLEELFANAAFSMFDIIADLEGLTRSTSIDVSLEAQDPEELLVKWLDELLFHFYTKWIIFFEFEILEIDERRIAARAHGRHVGENRNRLTTEIKAATYHNLKIQREAGRYSVEIIFDV